MPAYLLFRSNLIIPYQLVLYHFLIGRSCFRLIYLTILYFPQFPLRHYYFIMALKSVQRSLFMSVFLSLQKNLNKKNHKITYSRSINGIVYIIILSSVQFFLQFFNDFYKNKDGQRNDRDPT